MKLMNHYPDQSFISFSHLVGLLYVNIISLNFRQDLPMVCAHLPKLFTTVSQMWLSDKGDLLSNATHTLSAVIGDCLKLAAAPDVVERHTNTLSKVFAVLQEGLKYHYHSAWKHVIYLLGDFFEV